MTIFYFLLDKIAFIQNREQSVTLGYMIARFMADFYAPEYFSFLCELFVIFFVLGLDFYWSRNAFKTLDIF